MYSIETSLAMSVFPFPQLIFFIMGIALIVSGIRNRKSEPIGVGLFFIFVTVGLPAIMDYNQAQHNPSNNNSANVAIERSQTPSNDLPANISANIQAPQNTPSNNISANVTKEETQTSASNVSAKIQVVVIISEGLNLRPNPSGENTPDNMPLKELKYGEKLSLLSPDYVGNGWYHVQHQATGLKGWVHGNHIKFGSSP